MSDLPFLDLPFLDLAAFRTEIAPYVDRLYPGLSAAQRDTFTARAHTSILFGYFADTDKCSSISDRLPMMIEANLQSVAKDLPPSALVPPPSPHEALAALEKSRPLSAEQKMTAFRDFQTKTPDELLAAVDVNALVNLRAQSTAPTAKPTTGLQPSQTAADRWNAMTEREKRDEASYIFSKPAYLVNPSDLRKLTDLAKPNGLAERDARQIAALKARDPKSLDAASRMTLARWDRDNA